VRFEPQTGTQNVLMLGQKAIKKAKKLRENKSKCIKMLSDSNTCNI